MKRKPTEYEKHLAAIKQYRHAVHISVDNFYAGIVRDCWLKKRKPAKRRTKP